MKRAILIAFVLLIAASVCTASFEWERRDCAICGKTIWEKVEYSSSIDWNDNMILHVEDGVLAWSESDTAPTRTEIEYLGYVAKQGVCPHCEQKYQAAFTETMRTAMHTFIADAKEKESVRREIVAQENTQEELRRLEAQVQEVTEQLKSLTERLSVLKQASSPGR